MWVVVREEEGGICGLLGKTTILPEKSQI